jgi:uncharacterized membrane protein
MAGFGEGFWTKLRHSFLAGLLVLLPLALSLAVLWWIFKHLTGWLPFGYQTLPNRLLALAVLLLLIVSVGWMTRLLLGRQLLSFGESVIDRIPLLNRTYGFFKEVSHTLLGAKKSQFSRVVLVHYPKRGTFALGFVTSEAKGEVQAKTRSEVINVFVPTTPNPTSGFLLMVPQDEVIPLEMTVTEGMKLVISGGSIVPPFTPVHEETPDEHLI